MIILELHAVLFERAQFGWRCTIQFAFQTHRQFTYEYHKEEEGSRFWPIAFLKAYRSAQDTQRAIQGVVGPYNNEVVE